MSINKTKKKIRKKINPTRLTVALSLTFLIVFAVCGVLVSDIFDVKDINVTGNKKVNTYIVLNSIQDKHKNIFTYNKRTIEDRLKKNNYIESVEVKRKLPSTLNISILERQVYVALKNGDDYCYIDKEGNLLEKLKGTNESLTDKIVDIDYQILGYNKVEFKDEEARDKYFKIMSSIEKYGLYHDTRRVEMKNNEEIKIITSKNLKITLPNDDNFDYNIHRVSKVMVDLNNKKMRDGTVDLTKSRYAVYSPE